MIGFCGEEFLIRIHQILLGYGHTRLAAVKLGHHAREEQPLALRAHEYLVHGGDHLARRLDNVIHLRLIPLAVKYGAREVAHRINTAEILYALGAVSKAGIYVPEEFRFRRQALSRIERAGLNKGPKRYIRFQRCSADDGHILEIAVGKFRKRSVYGIKVVGEYLRIINFHKIIQVLLVGICLFERGSVVIPIPELSLRGVGREKIDVVELIPRLFEHFLEHAAGSGKIFELYPARLVVEHNSAEAVVIHDLSQGAPDAARVFDLTRARIGDEIGKTIVVTIVERRLHVLLIEPDIIG